MSRLAPYPCILALALLAASTASMASQQGVVAMKNWKTMDQCAKQARAAFPDFTAEANAKREAKESECLKEKNLPPRESLAPRP
ncbi:MAG TPA: hypothetical protein VGQ90_06795 [Stellaceae bacterium]|jgi:hypothetical protein|nr:hypothetical protein [Stellaceae bacterium]